VLANTDIVVPTYNEEATVGRLVERLRRACPGARLTFVDNASTDRTCEILEEGGPGLRLLRHERNLGYGRSIQDGIRAGEGEFVVVIDADLEYQPEDIPAIVSRLAAGEDVVHGSRLLAADRGPLAMSRLRALGNRLVTWLFNLLYGQRLTDLYTGLRGFRRSVLPRTTLESDGFEFVLELSAYFAHRGIRIAEVPVTYIPRSVGASKMRHLPEFLKYLHRLVYFRLSAPWRDEPAGRPGSAPFRGE
jgi:glycosyltransferase involved in cell wall biosynthesis